MNPTRTDTTLAEAIERFGVEVDPHLDRQTQIPVHADVQAQGDVLVAPQDYRPARRWARRSPITTSVPPSGIAVAHGLDGHIHLLLADGPVYFTADRPTASRLRIGVLVVPPGSTAYLAHPEHAYSGIAAGTYELRRQRTAINSVNVLVSD